MRKDITALCTLHTNMTKLFVFALANFLAVSHAFTTAFVPRTGTATKSSSSTSLSVGPGTFYRSDTRHPTNAPGNIFANGFTKRNAAYQDPVLRFPLGPDASPDIVPQSAVCFTRDFKAAPLFPVSDLLTNSWVYVIHMDTDAVYNSQQVQWEYIDGRGLLNGAPAQDAHMILWTMFGQERAANEVPATSIVGAVEVSRHFPQGDVFSGGAFRCLQYLANPNYVETTPNFANQVATVMNLYVNDVNPETMPSQADGYVPSIPI